MTTYFKNREEAGKILTEKLLEFQNIDPVILALPRGGVPIAYEIALKLHAALDVVLVKKIGAPGHEEFAIGAIAEDEKPILNEKIISQYKFNPDDIENMIIKRISEIRARSKVYRQKYPAIPLKGRNVIVVDDGLATGATMLAAISWLRTQDVKKIIVATPVSSKEAADEIKKNVDEFISLIIPENMMAVGMWYKDFTQVSDEEVLKCLQKQKGQETAINQRNVWIDDGEARLPGVLTVPAHPKGLILFAHGGGSSHKSPRNLFVSKALNDAGFGTLLFDLLTVSEALDRKNVFDISLMTDRLLAATAWVKKIYPSLPLGYFGASTGAAAALGAAEDRLDIFSIVSRGGRPDLALDSLPKVYAPTLLIVGEEDAPVIPLNELAKNKLKNSEIMLIPKAGHLFEEPGTLEQVVEYAVSWFSRCLTLHLETNIDSHAPVKASIIDEIEKHSIPFSTTNDLDSWIQKISKHRIVMLGESTHGTREFYSLRKEISKKLMQNHGFNFIAVEGDWPDCYKLNQHIHDPKSHQPEDIVCGEFHRWPTWMWANEEISSLIKWMKKNEVGSFYGLDVYSLFDSLDEIKKHIDHLEPNIAMNIMKTYKCFESYRFDEISYSRSLLKLPRGCQEEVINNLKTLLRVRLQETTFTKEGLFNAKQNARVIRNAEKYYRTMLTGGAESWNVRDSHMMETLEALLNSHGSDSKAIVWAHNSHIGDYHATDMLENGYINLGGLAREKFGVEDVFLLGLSTYQGKVTASYAWDGEEKRMDLPKAQTGSYEEYLHQASLNMKSDRLLVQFDSIEKNSFLNRKLPHRAVGVVYDSHESRGNYVPTQLAKRYDALIFVDKTTALESLPATFVHEKFPETWPLGQ